jgi:hypothetical protein
MFRKVAGHEAQGWSLDNNHNRRRLALLFPYAEEVKPSITQIETQTGHYFNEIGQIFFYRTQCKIVSYVNLKPTQVLWIQVKSHQLQIVHYCARVSNATWYALTDYRVFTPYVKSKVKYVGQLKDIVADYLTSQPKRVKRGILNIGGEVLRYLFGTFTQSDAKKYTQHIQKLEEEQQSFIANITRTDGGNKISYYVIQCYYAKIKSE